METGALEKIASFKSGKLCSALEDHCHVPKAGLVPSDFLRFFNKKDRNLNLTVKTPNV